MLVANNSSLETLRPVGLVAPDKRSWLWEVVFWLGGVALAFAVPLAIVLTAIVVSSYGIPLPIEVRVP